MDESKVKALIVAACELQGKIVSARKTCFDQYRAKETEQANSIRILVDGAVASMTMKMTQKIQETSETISYQISLSPHPMCELISSLTTSSCLET